ncbi:MAG: polysaccharide biosynthesis protein [Acidimicrobiales bacterium]
MTSRVRDDSARGPIGLLARAWPAIQAVADSAAWVAAVWVATWLRYEFAIPSHAAGGIVVAAFAAVALHLLIAQFTRIYRRRWRYASYEEVVALVWTVLASGVLLVVVNRLILDTAVPTSSSMGAGVGALVLMAAGRLAWRGLDARRRRPNRRDAAPVLVFGAGEAGRQLVAQMVNDPASAYVPVGLLDDDPAKANLVVNKVPVRGTRYDLERVATDLDATMLIIAVPSVGGELVRDLYDEALGLGLAVRVLPSVRELIDGVALSQVREVSNADLLGRGGITTDMDSIAHYLAGKRVLVTGAGGSIGSELCRQLRRFDPAELVMVDRDESGLHGVQMSIEGRALLDDPTLVVADVRDRDRMVEVFARFRPQVVFHAAALKHLSLLEMHPSEAVKTNVAGTQMLLELSAEVGVERFVNISTDKAANPTSVLGYTKRIAERLTAEMARRSDGVFVSVRFGNVLGSRGSMLGTFEAQIAAGGPITVTHPEVARYFMTTAEAVELVIQAGAIGRDGEVLVLDMGEPVRIDDVARRLIAASDRPLRIVYTGLRPGEKLREDLWAEGEVDDRPFHPLISHVSVAPIAPTLVEDLLATPADEVDAVLRRAHREPWSPTDATIIEPGAGPQ